MSTFEIQSIKNQLETIRKMPFSDLKKIMVPMLNEQRYQNEQQKKKEFDGFTDQMMLAHYLLRDTHVQANRGRSAKTISAYRSVLTAFYNQCFEYAEQLGIDFAQLPVDEQGNVSLYKGLTRFHIERYTEWLMSESNYVKEKGSYSAASISQKITIIKSFLKKLYEWEYIEIPLHATFKSVSLNKHDRPYRDMTPEQVVFLLDVFKEYNMLMFCFVQVLTTTGIRNNELCKLRVGDLQYDFSSGLYFLRINAKGNKDREVPIKQKTLACIRMFRRLRGAEPFEKMILKDPNAPLFMTRNGKAYTPSYLDQAFKNALERLPDEQKELLNERFTYYAQQVPGDRNSDIVRKVMDITPHVFRHAFAIASRRSSIDIDTIQRSLGHADRKTTEIYLESLIQKDEHAIHRWNGEILGDYV